MRKLILLGFTATVGLWASALWAQAPGNPPTANQTKVQKRDRIHTPGTGQAQAGPQVQQKQQKQQGNKNQTAQKGQKKKAGPADGTGNKGAGPKDGTGYGAKSGNRSGPMDGSGTRWGGRQTNQQGQFGSRGGARSGGRGRR
jgi:hypothetical protein